MSDWHTIAALAAAAANVVALVMGLIKLQRIAMHVQRTFDYFALEHEILMQDYAERHNLNLHELPTRLKRAPWWGRDK